LLGSPLGASLFALALLSLTLRLITSASATAPALTSA